MRALVIYDSTGRIWSIIYGEEALPQGVAVHVGGYPGWSSAGLY